MEKKAVWTLMLRVVGQRAQLEALQVADDRRVVVDAAELADLAGLADGGGDDAREVAGLVFLEL